MHLLVSAASAADAAAALAGGADIVDAKDPRPVALGASHDSVREIHAAVGRDARHRRAGDAADEGSVGAPARRPVDGARLARSARGA